MQTISKISLWGLLYLAGIAPSGIFGEGEAGRYFINRIIDADSFGRSSLTRYKRTGYLLSGCHSGFTMSDFIKFGSDKNDGPDNSIFRTGSSRNPNRTLATWIVELKKDGPPEIYVKLFNPGKEAKELRFTADNRFWQNEVY